MGWLNEADHHFLFWFGSSAWRDKEKSVRLARMNSPIIPRRIVVSESREKYADGFIGRGDSRRRQCPKDKPVKIRLNDQIVFDQSVD